MNSVICLLERAAALWGGRTAVSDEHESLSYAELRERSRRAASAIMAASSGSAPVMVWLPKSAAMLTGFNAAMYAGRPYVPTDAAAPVERLRKILANLHPSAVVTNAELAAKLEGVDTGGAPVLLIDELMVHAEDAAAVDAAVAAVTDSEPVYVMYTSGATGEPKGVTIPHRGVMLFARWAEETFGWTPETVIANQAPLYFDVSVMDVYGAMRCGGHLILTPEVLFRFPVKLPEFLSENGVTSIYWVPTVMIIIANSGVLETVELPKLRSIAFAGEVMPNLQLNIWRRALPGRIFANLYGPTETDVCTAYVVDREFSDTDPLPIGRPLPNMKVMLLGEDGHRVRYGETGEICIRMEPRPAGIMMEYYRDPEKTANAIYDGWYHTGDTAWVDEDGYFWYVGRNDDVIKSSGYRIGPFEIESELLEHEAVRECAVTGVPDPVRGFAVKATVVLADGFTGSDELTRELQAWVKHRTAPYKYPRIVEYVDALPKTGNGKIRRVAIRQKDGADLKSPKLPEGLI